jgi:hypothetical protein
MITQELLATQIINYLNGQTTLTELVHWAEDAIIMFTESDTRPPNADIVWDILLYVGAADSADFPLTWEVIKEMLAQLGRPMQQVTA